MEREQCKYSYRELWIEFKLARLQSKKPDFPSSNQLNKRSIYVTSLDGFSQRNSVLNPMFSLTFKLAIYILACLRTNSSGFACERSNVTVPETGSLNFTRFGTLWTILVPMFYEFRMTPKSAGGYFREVVWEVCHHQKFGGVSLNWIVVVIHFIWYAYSLISYYYLPYSYYKSCIIGKYKWFCKHWYI